MIVGVHRVGTLVEVFQNDEAAQAAVRELKSLGFTDSQIHVVMRPVGLGRGDLDQEELESDRVGENSDARAALTIGISALRKGGVYADISPEAGPVIEEGSQSVFLPMNESGSTAGTLVRIPVLQDEANHAKRDLPSSRTIVTVWAGTRADIACSVLNRFNRPEWFVKQAM